MIRKSICYQKLKDVQLDMDTNTYTRRICAEVLDMQETAIVQACIKAAKEAGIHDLYLMDKQFVIDALLAAIKGKTHARWQDHHCTNCYAVCTTCESPSGFVMCVETPYCPHCGAKMDGDQHDSC